MQGTETQLMFEIISYSNKWPVSGFYEFIWIDIYNILYKYKNIAEQIFTPIKKTYIRGSPKRQVANGTLRKGPMEVPARQPSN